MGCALYLHFHAHRSAQKGVCGNLSLLSKPAPIGGPAQASRRWMSLQQIDLPTTWRGLRGAHLPGRWAQNRPMQLGLALYDLFDRSFRGSVPFTDAPLTSIAMQRNLHKHLPHFDENVTARIAHAESRTAPAVPVFIVQLVLCLLYSVAPVSAQGPAASPDSRSAHHRTQARRAVPGMQSIRREDSSRMRLSHLVDAIAFFGSAGVLSLASK